MFETYNKLLAPLDNLTLNFNESGLLIMNITIAFVMFGVALGIKKNHFKDVANNPKSIIIGLISQFLLMPLMTFLLVIALKLPISISLGMILVAACPGGNVSNFMSSVAKGNTALSVSLTAFSDLGSIIMTPISFTLWGNFYINTLSDLAAPIHIPFFNVLKTIVLLMAIPLLLGFWFRNKFPKTTKKIFKPTKIISFIIFIGFIIGAIAANYKYFIDYLWLLLPIVFIHNLIALTTGFSFAKIMKQSLMNVKTITIETGIQNSGLALVLIFNENIFKGGLGGAAFIAAMWGVWHIVSGLIISSIWSYKREKIAR